ncbi:hypothetical protein KIN20_023611 [Parelaphostrongylus tenuis]|uniref:Uncharacterized protein n=1 Tax=Parelaphostrongylus tenuis TaxID=148309 RepID=A0AAD5N7C4_PARTN|nr:hypothetical protein KIN20_023611 [Parelaphostrongylus tenuis]
MAKDFCSFVGRRREETRRDKEVVGWSLAGGGDGGCGLRHLLRGFQDFRMLKPYVRFVLSKRQRWSSFD